MVCDGGVAEEEDGADRVPFGDAEALSQRWQPFEGVDGEAAPAGADAEGLR